MPDEHGDLQAVGLFVLIWVTSFLGVWATPFDYTLKVNWDIGTTILVISFAIMYFDFKGKIPIGEEMRVKIWFWLTNAFIMFFAGLSFFLNVVFWEPKTINGIEVVTYENLATFLYGIMGVSLIIYLVYRIKNKEKVMAKRARHHMLDALVETLEEKGVMTTEEWEQKIKTKKIKTKIEHVAKTQQSFREVE